ncbi:MAG: HAD family hydrolase [Chlamydiales bacterium]
MPGVEVLLQALEKARIKRCVVTNSNRYEVELLRDSHPILQSIPYWIVREDYDQPKPSPECYEKAIQKFGKEGDQIVGFEDSPRGLEALLGTSAKGIFVTECFSKKEIKALAHQLGKEFDHVSNFLALD